ncbi:MAG: hypothetical protein RBS39_12025 [Phycisphaerales bacterium]|nr:hypothetical protein [Phycisphaerales bacterium]
MATARDVDPRLAIALSGVREEAGAPWTGGVRATFDWVASLGARGVVIDATAPETRPRTLDRSARRDLAASMRRRGLACMGVDLWIPPEHFASPTHVDRAMAALEAAAGLASELCEGVGRVVSIETGEHVGSDLLSVMREMGEDANVRLADHRFMKGAGESVARLAEGLDCASVIMAGGDPASLLSTRGERIASVRLSDVGSVGRVGVGNGRLDVAALGAIAGTLWREGPVVIDLRGLRSPGEAARQGIDAWERARLRV